MTTNKKVSFLTQYASAAILLTRVAKNAQYLQSGNIKILVLGGLGNPKPPLSQIHFFLRGQIKILPDYTDQNCQKNDRKPGNLKNNNLLKQTNEK